MARFAGFDDLDTTRFSEFSTPLSSSRFSGFSMPGSETYGSMPRFAGPGSSVRLASGESLSSMPTLSRAGSTGTLSDRYFSDLGARPRSVSSVRSAPPIAERASLASSDMSYRWPGGMRNERVGLPHQRYRTGSDASLYAPSSTRSYAPCSARTSVLRDFDPLYTPRAGTLSRLSSEWEPLHISREPSVASFGRTDPWMGRGSSRTPSMTAQDFEDWMNAQSISGSRSLSTPVGSRGSTTTLDSVGTPSMRSYASDHSRLAERWDDGLAGGLVYSRLTPTAPPPTSSCSWPRATTRQYPGRAPRTNPFAESLPRTSSTGTSRGSSGRTISLDSREPTQYRRGQYFDPDATLSDTTNTRSTGFSGLRRLAEGGGGGANRGDIGGAHRGFRNPAYDGSRASTGTYSDDAFRNWDRLDITSSGGPSSAGGSSRDALLVPGFRRGRPNLPPIRRPNLPQPNIPPGVKARLQGVGKTVLGGLKEIPNPASIAR